MKPMYKLGRRRKTLLRVDPADKRSPMLRLLQDNEGPRGEVCIEYPQQWPTKAKAMRLGYLDGYGCMTEAGREYIKKNS